MTRERQSNFELLRILCMMGVLVGHVLITLYQEQIHSQDWSLVNQARVLLLNACAVGVNGFVLISGYFGITLSLGRVMRYWGQCLWYAILGFLLVGGSWLSLLFPVSESGLWFVICYFALMLISPLLNAGLSALADKELYKAVGALLFCDVYLGYVHQTPALSADGYDVFHLICIYCLGGLIARKQISLPHAGWWCIACFLLMTVLHGIKMVWSPMAVIYSLHHNAPMLILASLLAFLWAKEQKMPQSRMVNWVAASVFAVYLIHCNPSFGPYFRGWLSLVKDYSESASITFLLLSGSVIGVFTASVLIDKVRMWVFNCIGNLWLR